MRPIWLTIVLCPSFALASHPKPCIAADEAAQLVNKDVCISAHVYDVVELPDGTRFLDTCMPETPDEKCRFTIVSPKDDRSEVGELRKYRNMDVHVRGILQPMHGRTGMVLSHARQFDGGPPKFRPKIVYRSDLLEPVLRKLPSGWQSRNLQIVFRVEVVRDSVGPPQVLATHVW